LLYLVLLNQSPVNMKARLTMTMKQSVILRAKMFAKENGRSLSDIIEDYLKSVTSERYSSLVIDSLLVNSLKGSFYAPKDFDYKKELSEALVEKHLKNE
jgi:hypothetical protein